MAPGGRLANARESSSLHSWAHEVRVRIAGMRAHAMARASFDPVRVEAELYDALYGRRTGTVDNIVPVSTGTATKKRSVVSSTSSAPHAGGSGREKRREARGAHEQDLRHAA